MGHGKLFLGDIHSRMRGLVQFCSEGRVPKEIQFGSIFLWRAITGQLSPLQLLRNCNRGIITRTTLPVSNKHSSEWIKNPSPNLEGSEFSSIDDRNPAL